MNRMFMVANVLRERECSKNERTHWPKNGQKIGSRKKLPTTLFFLNLFLENMLFACAHGRFSPPHNRRPTNQYITGEMRGDVDPVEDGWMDCFSRACGGISST
jgi:hypothetical protein